MGIPADLSWCPSLPAAIKTSRISLNPIDQIPSLEPSADILIRIRKLYPGEESTRSWSNIVLHDLPEITDESCGIAGTTQE